MHIRTGMDDPAGFRSGAAPSPTRSYRAHIGVTLVLAALTACGDAPPSAPVTATIGPAGGSVVGPGGAGVVIPPGALGTATAIAIEQTSAGAPPLPSGLTPSGPMFAFTPHGTTFAVPVTMTLPFNPASVPAGSTPELYKTNAQNQWERVAGATFGANSVSGLVTGFSSAQVVVPPLQRFPPSRSWSFTELRGDALDSSPIPPDEPQPQTGGALFDLHDYGLAPDLLEIELPPGFAAEFPPDGRASGEVFSSESGRTYSAYTEAPTGNVGIPGDPIGSRTRLNQKQTFIKRAQDATLTFTVSSIVLVGRDTNGVLSRPCPAHHLAFACDLIKSEVTLIVTAVKKGELQRFWGVRSGVALQGANVRGALTAWDVTAWNGAFSTLPLWDEGKFTGTFKPDPNGFPEIALVELVSPRTVSVDLSSVDVGETFTLSSTVFATAYNRAGVGVSGAGGNEFPTYAAAYLRDPQQIGGTVLNATGLEATAPEEVEEGPEVPVEPAPCVPGPGPDPAAGVLQFGAPSFETAEGSTTPVITVTRTGGGRGAVTATVRTGDGSARAGTDYAPLNASVFFGDGDTAERFVEVLGLPNTVGGEAARTVNLTLSQPGGCAALGSQTSTVLTLTDDDAPPPPPDPDGFLDPGFGTGGKVTTPFGGDETAMALQSDGKIVMVGGRTDAFVLARYNPGGNLDPSFGTGGTVTTDLIPGGIVQEVANGLALQPDGKIVVVGYTRVGLPFSFALARYNADGSPDPSFGAGGKVTTGVSGRAFAVALQPDGKIVVAGDDTVGEDFRLARYNPDGSLDASFGSAGVVTTDLAGAPDVARNIVIQPNGAIVVSGDPFSPDGLTGMARYTAGGSLDSSFGAGGKLTLTGAALGAGLALQPDGRFVLVGSERTGTVTNAARFAVRRLNADGSPDPGFGTAGSAFTAFTTGRDAAAAVALQQDGKILVSGTANGTQFALARLNADGTPDTGFLGTGKTSFRISSFDASAENVAVQPGGKIVLGGFAQTTSGIGYALARVNP
ncbi:Calx-beta domain-containing protein [Deinococcus aestuarii]|uniref:Calx-beta domain-containing protein n=1 Tax=Deinococcus aestuarii TaxID=2774531 RepID=UPI001C0C3225|nr:Calx-beta domain-containing protein [Deinococcus aestuarii]